MIQPGFDATTEDQLGWDEFGLSQLTQVPVGTQPT
jgi:hypothetical protein